MGIHYYLICAKHREYLSLGKTGGDLAAFYDKWPTRDKSSYEELLDNLTPEPEEELNYSPGGIIAFMAYHTGCKYFCESEYFNIIESFPWTKEDHEACKGKNDKAYFERTKKNPEVKAALEKMQKEYPERYDWIIHYKEYREMISAYDLRQRQEKEFKEKKERERPEKRENAKELGLVLDSEDYIVVDECKERLEELGFDITPEGRVAMGNKGFLLLIKLNPVKIRQEDLANPNDTRFVELIGSVWDTD